MNHESNLILILHFSLGTFQNNINIFSKNHRTRFINKYLVHWGMAESITVVVCGCVNIEGGDIAGEKRLNVLIQILAILILILGVKI